MTVWRHPSYSTPRFILHSLGSKSGALGTYLIGKGDNKTRSFLGGRGEGSTEHGQTYQPGSARARSLCVTENVLCFFFLEVAQNNGLGCQSVLLVECSVNTLFSVDYVLEVVSAAAIADFLDLSGSIR